MSNHGYKKAMPDIDSSYGKYVLGKTARMMKPVISVPFKVALGITVIGLVFFALWGLTVGLYRLGWMVGGPLNIFDVARMDDPDYVNRIIGPAPWLIGLGTFAIPVIGYFIGDKSLRSLKRKFINV